MDVHALPPIFHYWSNRHLLPKFQSLGFSSPQEMFGQQLRKVGRRPARFLSLGSGNCDLEISLALTLQGDFTIDCLDVNPTMLERGWISAGRAGVSRHLNFVPGDLNSWNAAQDYDAVIANQSLHHVVNLEGLFENIQRSLRPAGRFLISDMIGRNGHQRWPEALAIVHEFWRKLPPSYRFNQLVGYYEELYQSWDCSVEGFEGVRAQDILPLLPNRFHFHLFLPYGNVIDPFIDRAFGHHFDAASEWDRKFIDAVHYRDEKELNAGRLMPTHMIAVLAKEPCSSPRFLGHLTPASCVRAPDRMVCEEPRPSPYAWSWPHDSQSELEIACARLAPAGDQIRQRTGWALGLEKTLEERTAWAIGLDADVKALVTLKDGLEKELDARTAWARGLQQDAERYAALARELQTKGDSLEREIEERTKWALGLRQELAGQAARAERLEREAHNLLHNPLHLARRLLAGIRNRAKAIMKLTWNIAR